ncbi:MAG: hypothetical protein ACI841_001144 [Planctomycetota bacterium]
MYHARLMLQMRNWIVPMVSSLLSLCAFAGQEPSEDGGDVFLDASFLKTYCISCHAGSDAKGELRIDERPTLASIADDLDQWNFLLERVELEEMPPRTAEQPNAKARAAFATSLRETLTLARNNLPVDPGRPSMRRLNLREYEAAIFDLVGVRVRARDYFPEDGSGHGFDTVGDGLNLSELFVEASVAAAETIAEIAVPVNDPDAPNRRLFEGAGLDGFDRGSFKVLSSQGDVAAHFDAPRAGRYRLIVSATAQQAGPDLAKMGIVVGTEVREGFEIAAHFPSKTESHALEVQLARGPTRVAARFLNDYYRPKDPDPAQRDRNLLIESIVVEGPLDPPPRTSFQVEIERRFGHGDSKLRERAVLSHLIRRVWRRPAAQDELSRLLSFPLEGANQDQRLRWQLSALLASPHFLFRMEPAKRSEFEMRPLSGPELATRLSLLLWSTVPSAELDALADSGELAHLEARDNIVREMLASPRARAFSEGFAKQWLQLGPLERVQPDPELFPTWSDSLRNAMMRESIDLFANILSDRRPIQDLLDADWSWMNEELARHYGIADVQGTETRRVSLANHQRRGLLGHASIMTVTSDPARTSPVMRGRWVLDVLLNAPPPAAPPEVPAFDDSPESSRVISLRERWAMHRSDPNCAVCHDVMDPLGFGLENYDAIGRWRDRYEHFEVDASGELPDGRRFDGPRELAQVLLRDDRFRIGLIERILVYAIGRPMTARDQVHIDRIADRLTAGQATLHELLLEVTRSIAFTHTRTRAPQ